MESIKELKNKIEELSNIKDCFDFLLKVSDFEKDYKKTYFYKKTRIKLLDLVSFYKNWNSNFDTDKILDFFNDLNGEKILKAIDDFGRILSNENQEIENGIETLKNLDFIFKK